MTCWEELANAIVLRAVNDYRLALRALMKAPENKRAMAMAMEVEKFFHSDWYTLLTDVDEEYLIEKLRKEALE